MSLLTEQERIGISNELDLDIHSREFDAIEAAVIKKMAACVKAEPKYVYHYVPSADPNEDELFEVAVSGMVGEDCAYCEPLYTATAIAAARVQALEEAASLIDAEVIKHYQAGRDLLVGLRDAIRALIGGQE